MRIERAIFYKGRYEGVYELVKEEDELEWQYVSGTYVTGDEVGNQKIIDLHIRLDLLPERFQHGWEKNGKYYCILGTINFKPEDLNENNLSHN